MLADLYYDLAHTLERFDDWAAAHAPHAILWLAGCLVLGCLLGVGIALGRK